MTQLLLKVRFLNFVYAFSLFHHYPTLGIMLNLLHTKMRYLWSLVEICPVVLENHMKTWKFYIQIGRQTTDNKQSKSSLKLLIFWSNVGNKSNFDDYYLVLFPKPQRSSNQFKMVYFIIINILNQDILFKTRVQSEVFVWVFYRMLHNYIAEGIVKKVSKAYKYHENDLIVLCSITNKNKWCKTKNSRIFLLY